MDQAALERLWRRRAASLAGRLNRGWWLERFNAGAVAALVPFAIAIVAIRTWREALLSAPTVGIASGGLLLLVALFAWMRTRRAFVGAEDGLVRLDDRLRLHNRLSSASRRVGEWPPFVPETADAVPRWKPSRALLPGFTALALVAGAWWVPVPDSVAAPPLVPVEPGAWAKMEDWLATLEEEQLVEEETLEDLQSKIEELRDQPEEEWFSHSSLEATDTLAESLGLDLREMARELSTLERDLAALRNFASQMSDSARTELERRIGDALDALGESGLAVNEELLKQLSEIDPSQLGEAMLASLSEADLKSLQERLREGSKALGSLEGLPGDCEDCEGLGLAFGEKPGLAPGQGGITRGRGDAPLSLGEEKEGLGTSNLESVTNTDFSRATVGEVLGLGETEREVDRSAIGPQAGGAISSAGRGGETVSRETLLPDEQAVLKRFFK